MAMNTEYRDRVAAAIYDAIMTASMTDQTDEDGRPVAVVMSDELQEALLGWVAYFTAKSEALNTPQRLRIYCEGIAKRAGRMIQEVQRRGTGIPITRVGVPN
jgi:hypothetical protein